MFPNRTRVNLDVPQADSSFIPPPRRAAFCTLARQSFLTACRIAKLGTALKASFEFCNTALAKVDDSNLSDEVELFGGHKGTRAFALIAFTNDWADHHSSAAMYLRSNGMLTPTAQPKK
jgi:hypothetical protein